MCNKLIYYYIMVNDKDKLSEFLQYLKKKLDKLSERKELDLDDNDYDIGDESHIVVEKLKKYKREFSMDCEIAEKTLLEKIKELQ